LSRSPGVKKKHQNTRNHRPIPTEASQTRKSCAGQEARRRGKAGSKSMVAGEPNSNGQRSRHRDNPIYSEKGC